MALVEGWPLDLGFADVLCDDRAQIVIFRCGCRWVWLLTREPGAILCSEHKAGRSE